MRYLDIITKIPELESEVGVAAIKYGLYSVDKHCYLNRVDVSTGKEDAFKNEPWLYNFGEPKFNDNVAQYILDHKGRLYYPAHQKGCRHGFMIEFDMSIINKTLRKTIYTVYQEPNGQLVLDFE